MSERELYIKLTPKIAEMIIEVKKMPLEQYEEFKKEWLDECKQTAPGALEFTKKVLTVVDTFILKEGTAV